MLKAKQCSQILGRINSDGIETTILLHSDGSLLASSGNTQDARLIAGIVANLYQIYANSGHNSLNAESLMCLLSDCEHGRLAVTCIGSASGSDHMLLLCTYGPADKVEFGTLKSKLMTLREALDAPLQQLNAS